MFAWIWRFLTDADEFTRLIGGSGGLVESLKGPVKAFALAVGAMMLSGQIDLGAWTPTIAAILMGGQGLIQKTPTAVKTAVAVKPPVGTPPR